MKFIRSYGVDAFQFLPDTEGNFVFPHWFIDFYAKKESEHNKEVLWEWCDHFKIQTTISEVKKIKTHYLLFYSFHRRIEARNKDWVVLKDKRIFRVKGKDFKPPEWIPVAED